MPAPYTVQKFRHGYALVQWGINESGKRARRRTALASQDRASAEAEARKVWADADRSAWTVGRIMTGYLASITAKQSHGRRSDAWKAMRPFWVNVEEGVRLAKSSWILLTPVFPVIFRRRRVL